MTPKQEAKQSQIIQEIVQELQRIDESHKASVYNDLAIKLIMLRDATVSSIYLQLIASVLYNFAPKKTDEKNKVKLLRSSRKISILIECNRMSTKHKFVQKLGRLTGSTGGLTTERFDQN